MRWNASGLRLAISAYRHPDLAARLHCGRHAINASLAFLVANTRAFGMVGRPTALQAMLLGLLRTARRVHRTTRAQERACTPRRQSRIQTCRPHIATAGDLQIAQHPLGVIKKSRGRGHCHQTPGPQIRRARRRRTGLYPGTECELRARRERADAGEVLRSRFPAQIKLGPAERLRDLVNLALLGIALRVLPAAPRQIPTTSSSAV